ncbi:MAG: hypothetical protein ABSE77_23880 [Acidimicrobiales bacterium]
MGADPGKTRPAGEAAWVAAERQRLKGWRGAILRLIPLIDTEKGDEFLPRRAS